MLVLEFNGITRSFHHGDTEARSAEPRNPIPCSNVPFSVSPSDYSNVETNLLVVMHRVELNAEAAEGAENRVRLRALRVLRVSSPSPQSFDASSIAEFRHSSVAMALCWTTERLVFPAPSGKTAAIPSVIMSFSCVHSSGDFSHEYARGAQVPRMSANPNRGVPRHCCAPDAFVIIRVIRGSPTPTQRGGEPAKSFGGGLGPRWAPCALLRLPRLRCGSPYRVGRDGG